VAGIFPGGKFSRQVEGINTGEDDDADTYSIITIIDEKTADEENFMSHFSDTPTTT
jgi:hypothetical protein